MIDPAYFRSRQFAVAGIVALLVMAGGAASVAWSGAGGAFLSASDACRALPVDGQPVETGREWSASNGGRHVEERYWTDGARLASVRACVAVGEVVLVPSPDDSLHVLVRIRSDDGEATNATRMEVRFARGADGTNLVIWQSRVGHARGPFGNEGSARTSVEIRVPDGPGFDLRATVDVGDVRATGLALRNVTVRTDVGDVRLLGADLSGDLNARADVGAVVARLESVQSATLRLVADVGEIELRLPTRADVGYDVVASSDVGGVTVDVGPTEHYREDADTPGKTVEARTRGYASMPTKVRVEAEASVGSVLVNI